MRVGILLCLLLAGVAPADDSLNVRLLGRLHQESSPLAVAVDGDRAFLGGILTGLTVVSVANPASPIQTGSLSDMLHAVAANGDYIYALGPRSALRVISVADSAHPTEVGRCEAETAAWSLAVAGEYAYVTAADDSLLMVISVADPTQPTVVGEYLLPQRAGGICVVGSHAYVADRDSGLRIMSLADPVRPVEVGYCGSHSYAVCVAVQGDYAFVGDIAGGFQTISVADPALPVEISYLQTQHFARTIAVAGDQAYLSCDEFGLRVLDIHDPADPVEVGYYVSESTWSNYLAADGGYIYVARSNGLGVFEFYGQGSGGTPDVGGQPAEREPTTVVRHLPPGAVTFDAAGRRVLHPKPGVYFLKTTVTAAPRKVLLVE